MKESYSEGVASHTGPESCLCIREGVWEALTGESAGRVLSRERNRLRGADGVVMFGRQHRARRYRETCGDPARSETPCTHRNTLRGTREVPLLALYGVVYRVRAVNPKGARL